MTFDLLNFEVELNLEKNVEPPLVHPEALFFWHIDSPHIDSWLKLLCILEAPNFPSSNRNGIEDQLDFGGNQGKSLVDLI